MYMIAAVAAGITTATIINPVWVSAPGAQLHA
jgi:hypothetical protein